MNIFGTANSLNTDKIAKNFSTSHESNLLWIFSEFTVPNQMLKYTIVIK